MGKELRVDGILYLEVEDGETAEDAMDRFAGLLESIGISLSEHEYAIVEY